MLEVDSADEVSPSGKTSSCLSGITFSLLGLVIKKWHPHKGAGMGVVMNTSSVDGIHFLPSCKFSRILSK